MVHKLCYAHGLHLAVCDFLYKNLPFEDPKKIVTNGNYKTYSLILDVTSRWSSTFSMSKSFQSDQITMMLCRYE